MTNPTSNFGWQMPTASDLVTDLPADFETFGQAVDTSLADLKGGTSGQILAKASNTDMDFTWVTNDVGDITAVTAGTGITGGGTSGAVTVSFDQANFGGGQYAAGKNKIINGDFGIWQRGTSFAISANSAYTADRYLSDAGSMNYTFSRQSFTAGTAPVSGYESAFFFRALATSGSGGYPKIIQKIEDVRTFAGQTVTLSFWGKASSSISIAPDLIQEFGSGGSSTVYTGSVTTAITTSWARYSITYAVPSISGKTIGTGSSLTVSFNLPSSGTASFDTWGWQLEAGSTATPFQTATGNPQGELAACQRYYYRISTNQYNPLTNIGGATATTSITLTLQTPVTMRADASSLDYANLSVYGGGTSGFGFLSVSSLALIRSNGSIAELTATVTGATTGAFYRVQPNNQAGYIGLVAEL